MHVPNFLIVSIFCWYIVIQKDRPGGGGERTLIPQFGRYVPRQSEKWGPQAWLAAVSRPWAAINDLNVLKENFENDGLRSGKMQNGDALERKYFAICENDMLRNGNLGLEMGVSPVAHT